MSFKTLYSDKLILAVFPFPKSLAMTTVFIIILWIWLKHKKVRLHLVVGFMQACSELLYAKEKKKKNHNQM